MDSLYDVLDVVGGLLLIVGALLILLAGIGVVRFPDIYSRMHAAAKGPALGVLVVGVGTALMVRSPDATIVIGLVIVLQLITGPVGTHLLGRAVYRAMSPPLDTVDELRDAEAAERDEGGGSE